MISSLITTLDAFQTVRDQIAAILVSELANQQALAIAAAEDPVDWTVRVFKERHFPIESWLNSGTLEGASQAPICSVWMESANFNPKSSTNTNQQQIYDAIYNLDVFAHGIAGDVAAGGHTAADEQAHAKCQNAVKLVRRIMTASEYIKLGLPNGVIWPTPHFESLEFDRPAAEELPDDFAVWGCRCRFAVKLNEAAPAFEDYDTLDLIRCVTSDSPDGDLLFTADIDLTP